MERWCGWWRSEFVETPFCRLGRRRFAEPVAPEELPNSLLERFAGDDEGKLVAVLRFLRPLVRAT